MLELREPWAAPCVIWMGRPAHRIDLCLAQSERRPLLRELGRLFPEDEAEVYVEERAIRPQHDVLLVTVSDAEQVGEDYVRCQRLRETPLCLDDISAILIDQVLVD